MSTGAAILVGLIGSSVAIAICLSLFQAFLNRTVGPQVGSATNRIDRPPSNRPHAS